MTRDVLDWSAGVNVHVPSGVLPDGSGFLVHRIDASDHSRLHAVSFAGDVQLLVPVLDASRTDRLVGDLVEGFWPACNTVRRLGPACELYCTDPAGTLWRMPLAEGEPEEVSCSLGGGDVRVMDVRQRSIE